MIGVLHFHHLLRSYFGLISVPANSRIGTSLRWTRMFPQRERSFKMRWQFFKVFDLGGPAATAVASKRATVVRCPNLMTEEIRPHFPALERRHNGHSVAYFDGPGGTQVPRSVVEAMSDYLVHHNANTHWAYPTSAETDATIENSRQALADFLNGAPTEI